MRKVKLQKTPVPSLDSIERKWYLVDARGKILGRLATQIAQILRGKRKVSFTPHLDVGDFVVVVNASAVRLTGKKLDNKEFRWFTGYPGGLRRRPYRDLLAQNPEKVIRHAVWGMLPHNRLGRKLLKKLKIYPGESHPHQAQKPEKIEI
ncbi:50S ribosomal protein L13 [bacterium]|nr:50S ribosomal protein L13 [bacterium]RKZ27961.1 MAG: 50S ribosomal protein L13 [bacterium]